MSSVIWSAELSDEELEAIPDSLLEELGDKLDDFWEQLKFELLPKKT